MLGFRGEVIVGTHSLVVTPSMKIKTIIARLGIVHLWSFTELTQFKATSKLSRCCKSVCLPLMISLSS